MTEKVRMLKAIIKDSLTAIFFFLEKIMLAFKMIMKRD